MKKIHYAWVICFACALLLFCIGGLCINAFGIYLPFIREQNGFSNTQASTLVTLRNLGCFAAMLLSGYYYKKFPLRTSFRLQAAAITAALLVVFLLLRNDPKDKGLLPYGDGEVESGRRVTRHGRKLEKRDWILLFPMIVMLGVINTCGYTQLTLLATNKGFPAQTVAAAISVTGIGLIVGKFTYGVVSEKFGTVTGNWIYGSLVTLGLGLCCLAKSNGLLFTAFGMYAFGLSIATVGLTTWPGELAAPEQYDRTVQKFQTVSTAGALVFSSVPGILADLFGGSYVPAYIGFTAFAALAVLIIQYLYHRGRKA